MKILRSRRHNAILELSTSTGHHKIKFYGGKATVQDDVADIANGLGNGFYWIANETFEIVLEGSKVLVVRDMGLGDVLLVTPLLRELRAKNAHVAYMVSSRYAPVFLGNPNIDEVLSYDHTPVESISPLYDIVLNLVRRPEELDSQGLHDHRVKQFCASADITTNDYGLDYYIFDDEREVAKALLKNHLIDNRTVDGIRIAYIWSASHDTRNWTHEKHLQVLWALVKAGYTPVLIHHEKVQIDVPNVINLTNELSIRESAAVMDSCAAVISPDTGAFHLASALKLPVVAYFSTMPLENRRTHTNVIPVINEPDVISRCAKWPCKTYHCWNRRSDRLPRCLDMDPSTVIEAIKGIISDRSSKRRIKAIKRGI